MANFRFVIDKCNFLFVIYHCSLHFFRDMANFRFVIDKGSFLFVRDPVKKYEMPSEYMDALVKNPSNERSMLYSMACK